MKMQGFTLIELLIALVISSFVMTMIFNTIALIQRSSARYNSLITANSQQEILFSQLQKDISAMLIPLYGFIPSSKDSAEEKNKKQSDYYQEYGLRIDIEDDQLKTITFVTTSPLGSSHRLVRVTYSLIPHKNDKNVYTMVRQEADLSKKTISSYEVCNNITSCMISCTIIRQEEGKKKVQEFSSWSLLESMNKKDKNGSATIEKKIEIPQIISLKGTCRDQFSNHEYSFNHSFFTAVDARSSKNKSDTWPQQATTPEKPAEQGKLPSSPFIKNQIGVSKISIPGLPQLPRLAHVV